MSRNIELVIFDMDGLMFDTERIGHLAWERVAAKYQFSYSIDITKRFIGRNYDAIMAVLKDAFGENAPVELWHSESWKERKNIFEENGTLGLKPGLIEILNFFKEMNIKMAVASSSRHSDIVSHLQHEGVNEYFDFVIGGDEVKESKPNPEIFLKPCEALNILPENSLVIEDSYNGFLAARAAGIPVMIVPDLVEPKEDVLKEAAGVFPSLHEVRSYIEEFLCLVK
ncbi:HAD family hydrolase [Bacillus marasmi]|uniref:HAD family hydrolase n=1 Tax=Bacillus marasmi TaxID=1926279 RepID=UPI0011C6F609|nr:HAD family phosphatase [Bacillus marasmi]